MRLESSNQFRTTSSHTQKLAENLNKQKSHDIIRLFKHPCHSPSLEWVFFLRQSLFLGLFLGVVIVLLGPSPVWLRYMEWFSTWGKISTYMLNRVNYFYLIVTALGLVVSWFVPPTSTIANCIWLKNETNV